MKITIDPVTRLEGHLSVSLEVQDGRVSSAYCAGTMFRGFELILQGRDPFDAPQITQRICGVCPVSHGIASSLCIEDSLGVQPSENGRLLRNLILGANYIQSHIIHFYHLSALDFIDIKAILTYTGNDPALLNIRNWAKSELQNKTINPVAPFLPRFEGNYIADPEINIGAINHYLQALRIRTVAHEMVSIFGGKIPHVASLVPGGVTSIPTVDKIEAYRTRLKELQAFINGPYLQDVIAVAQAFPEYFGTGKGPNVLLTYGGFPLDSAGQDKMFSAGVYRSGELLPLDATKILEFTQYSWLSSPTGLHPASGETAPEPDKPGAYSWVKAPRYDNNVVEVGPVARVLVTHQSGKNPALSTLLTRTLSNLDLSIGQLTSTLGRHLVRVLESKMVAEQCEAWLDQLQTGVPGISQEYKVPKSASGMGLMDAPRGALGHWISIEDSLISHYECVVPTTWNCSPRDDQGRPGAVEQALEGLQIADRENPIEALRVIHSYDPCLACAVH